MKHYIIEDRVFKGIIFIPPTLSPDKIIPEGIEEVGALAFADNTSLTKIIIPEGVKFIAPGAFYRCSNLEEVVLPHSLDLVGEGAFASCRKLRKVTYDYKTSFQKDVFDHCSSLKELVVDNVSWRSFYFIQHNQFVLSLKDTNLSTPEYTVYKGKFMTNVFPAGNPAGYSEGKDDLLYFVVIQKDGSEYMWYDPELPLAILGAQYQASGESAVSFFRRTFNQTDTITPKIFSVWSGICYSGIRLWCEKNNKTAEDEVTIESILEDIIYYAPNVYKRVIKLIDSQYSTFNLLDLSNGVKWSDIEQVELVEIK